MSGGLVEGSGANTTRGFRRIVTLLIALVTVPTGMLLLVGIAMLVFYNRANLQLLFGILVITLVGCMVTGSVLALVFLRRQANLSKLQMDFVSKVSHELKTPLTSIRMFVEMLHMKRVSNPEELEACFDVLSRETERLSERIDRLLDWGRMEAGRRVYQLHTETVPEMVHDAVLAFDATTLGRKVDVKLDIAPSLPKVSADRAAFIDALVNLLSNAYKYTTEDKLISVTVTADDKWVSVAVRDNGMGIARGEHRRVFEKFYRADERLSREVEGSGLGLAIVNHVARGHRGRVDLVSAPGKGSTFTLLLPALRPTDA
ncbi:MAG: two-component sensor histidine kinase [Sandaracinaceae bacterium]|nr:two-component sensor histidine kinase [Sandaracinaceae bacterium]